MGVISRRKFPLGEFLSGDNLVRNSNTYIRDGLTEQEATELAHLYYLEAGSPTVMTPRELRRFEELKKKRLKLLEDKKNSNT